MFRVLLVTSHHLTPTPTRVRSPCSVGDTERHVPWTLERAPLSGRAGTSLSVQAQASEHTTIWEGTYIRNRFRTWF